RARRSRRHSSASVCTLPPRPRPKPKFSPSTIARTSNWPRSTRPKNSSAVSCKKSCVVRSRTTWSAPCAASRRTRSATLVRGGGGAGGRDEVQGGGVERRGAGGAAARGGLAAQLFQQGDVAAMDAVKVADGHRPAAAVGRRRLVPGERVDRHVRLSPFRRDER